MKIKLHLTTHSTRPPLACLSCTFAGSIRVVAVVGRRVDSGVMRLFVADL
jgi:hypothetical protein